MNYALNLGADGRILSATYPQFAPKDAVLVEKLPEGDISHYRYADGVLVYDPVTNEPAEEHTDHGTE